MGMYPKYIRVRRVLSALKRKLPKEDMNVLRDTKVWTLKMLMY